MNRTPWDEALVEASGHLANLQQRVAQLQQFIAMGLSDGCLPVFESHLEDLQENLDLAFERVRSAMHHTCKQAMVVVDPAVGEQPLYPNQPTYCEKYGHPEFPCRICGATK